MSYRSEAWYRQYEASQKIPQLPADDEEFDNALAVLREAVAEISPNGAPWISEVVRILRHRRGLAADVLHKREPTCQGCGADRKCVGCDDIRPSADKLYPGWRFVSPLDRWETVERVAQETEYSPMQVWTDKTGPDYAWLIPHWHKIDGNAPSSRVHGTPEIRIIEYDYARDAPMYAVTTTDLIYRPGNDNHLVEAHYSRDHGWTVTHRPDGAGATVVIRCDSKAKARTALREAARRHAKALGVKVVVQPKDSRG